MNKRILIILINLTALSFFSKISAQTVLNGGFENWTQKTYLLPDITPTKSFDNSNIKSYPANVLTLTKTANGTGSAMRIETKTYLNGSQPDTSIGFAIWGHNTNSNGPLEGGFPFTDQNVTGLSVNLKYSLSISSPGMVLVQFKKNGVPVGGGNAPLSKAGIYAFPLTGTQSSYATMNFNFTPALPMAPDSCVIAFISNNPFNNGGGSNGHPGDFMELDSIMFAGTSQTVPGGNLDTWVNSAPLESLDFWKFDDNTLDYKTTDKNSGNFAIALSVISHNSGGGNKNLRGYLGDITYLGNNNYYKPGMAVTGRPQSLGFFYKYSSPGVDSGSAYVRLTQWNGTSRVDVGGGYMYLLPQSNYTYAYIAMSYQNGLTPDSAYVEFSSSKQYPNSVIGSLLKVDDVRFNYCNEALIISGNNIVCPNAVGVKYSIQATPMSTYSWSVPAGASITAGAGTDSITVSFGASPAGTVSVIKTYVDGCANRTVSMSVASQAPATANAGPDQSICANGTATLNGSKTNATGGIWTGGAGTFAPSNLIQNATYTPSAAEKNAGTVTLTFAATGGCNAASDQMAIIITPAPTANAGPDQTICKNASSATLAGAVTIASGGNWTTSGTGSFNPSSATLNASYLPSAADKTAGSVTLTLSTTGNGLCSSVSDAMVLTLTTAPTANAGPDQTKCANNAVTSIAGSVTVATGGVWSGSGTFGSTTSLTTTYIPTAAETALGLATITITTSGGTCPPVSDQMNITLTASPFANAGPDQSICAGTNATLAGSETVATGATWTTSGSGSFSPNATTLNASYVPSAIDKNSGSVTLTLTTTGNGACNAVSDAMILTILANPTSNAGPDASVCSGTSVSLNGSVANSTGGTWSGGTGTFAPSSNTQAATYTPSASEITAGTVTLTLTSTGSSCTAASDQIVITVVTATSANAGADQSVCSGASANLNGTIGGATGGTWTTSGTGSFNPDANTLSASYTPSAADISSGSVTLTLTTTGNGSCVGSSDQMTITVAGSAAANAGADMSICDNQTASLSGSITGTSGGIWTSSGTGTFTPGPTTLNGVYSPSLADATAGSVVLTLTSTGNGSCAAASDQTTVTITSCTGISVSSASNELKVYPSPASSVVHVEIRQGESISGITVLNSMSQDVHVGILEMNGNTASIDMSGLNTGMYVIRIMNGQSVILQKIIKE